MACSALKRDYRDRLRGAVPDLVAVHLDGTPETIRARQATRPGHFMPASLLDSQFATLEPLGDDESGVVLDVARGVDELVSAAVAAITSEDR